MDSITILIITMSIIGLIEIFGFIIALFYIRYEISKLNCSQENYTKRIDENLKFYLERLKTYDDIKGKILEQQSKTMRIITEQYKTMNENYQLIVEGCRELEKRYTSIADQYSKIITLKVTVEERYSETYEQLAEINKKLDSIKKTFDQVYWNMDELGAECIHTSGDDRICLNTDCPNYGNECNVGADNMEDCKYYEKNNNIIYTGEANE